MGGTPTYVYRDGQRLTLWMLYVITLLDVDLFRIFGVHVMVTSAIRTYAEQEAIFRDRYVTAGNIRGRTVYDTRMWNGVRWYRISAAGTVAVPSFSNHEIQGSKAAVDIRDTGSDAGITSKNSVRGRWLRDWCRRTGLLIASGDGFGEGWHFDVPGIFRTPPALPAGSADSITESTTPPESEEDDDMPKNAGICTTANDKPISDKNPADIYAIVNTGSGYFSPVMGLSGNPGATDLVRAFDVGGPVTWVTKSHYLRIEADCAAVRRNA